MKSTHLLMYSEPDTGADLFPFNMIINKHTFIVDSRHRTNLALKGFIWQSLTGCQDRKFISQTKSISPTADVSDLFHFNWHIKLFCAFYYIVFFHLFPGQSWTDRSTTGLEERCCDSRCPAPWLEYDDNKGDVSCHQFYTYKFSCEPLLRCFFILFNFENPF